MKTTIDLPADIIEQTKIAAARRRTTIKNLVIEDAFGVRALEKASGVIPKFGILSY